MSITINSTEAEDIRLCTLADVKTELEISSTAHDDYLNKQIKRAGRAIESYTQRRFQLRNVTEKQQGQGSFFALLSYRPVWSISSVKLDGSTVGSTTYQIDNKEGGLIFRGSDWSTTLIWKHTIEPVYTGVGYRDWEFTYVGGYELPNSTAFDSSTRQLPEDLEYACLLTVKSWFLDRKHNSKVKSESIGDASETRFSPNTASGGAGMMFSEEIRSILNAYLDVAPTP